MTVLPRYLESWMKSDLDERKMVFLGGPRQVGKTSSAIQFLTEKAKSDPGYMNWDVPASKKAILEFQLPVQSPMLVLDEIHKYSKWKSLLKGLYDRHSDEKKFIVTGSARLDLFEKGGDSLMGRYHYYRLHPFSLGEIDPTYTGGKTVETLLRYGGFPDPFKRADKRFLRRWQNERGRRVIREDIRDLTMLRDLDQLELLNEILPSRVGSPLSIQNLKKDLNASHESLVRWIQAFERFYVCYRLPPYGAPRIKAVMKEQKLYLWDWSVIEAESFRFENMVASQLLKKAHFEEDVHGYKTELRYLRNSEGREIDFVYMKNKKPVFAVECKISDSVISPQVKYFAERVDIPTYYQVTMDGRMYETKIEKSRVVVLPFHEFCRLTMCP